MHSWLYALQKWKLRELEEHRVQPTWDRISGDGGGAGGDGDLAARLAARGRGGNTMQRYAQPFGEASVIMSRHLDQSGMPLAAPEGLMTSLNASGITRLIVGHTYMPPPRLEPWPPLNVAQTGLC